MLNWQAFKRNFMKQVHCGHYIDRDARCAWHLPLVRREGKKIKIVIETSREEIVRDDRFAMVTCLTCYFCFSLLNQKVLTWTRQTIKTPSSAGTSIPFIFLPWLTVRKTPARCVVWIPLVMIPGLVRSSTKKWRCTD